MARDARTAVDRATRARNAGPGGTVGEWRFVATAGAGMFLSTLDTGIVNIALPTLQAEFGADASAVAWSVTAYLLTLSATIVLFGRLGDRYGRVKVYAAGLAAFGVASALCGLSGSAVTLVVARALQGVSAAMVQGTAAALVTTGVSPARRGSAMGTLGLLMGLGPILGPTVGGGLLSTLGWRWLFWINLPFCLAGLLGCRALAGADRSDRADHRPDDELDLPGLGLFAASAVCLLLTVTWWSAANARWWAVASAAGCTGTLAMLVRHERRAARPLLAPRLWRRPAFAAAFVGLLGFGVSAATVFMLPPFFLERVAGLAPWQTGLVAFAGPLGLVLTARLAGGLTPRLGTFRPMAAGLALLAAASTALGLATADWPPLALVPPMLLWGLGGGAFQIPNVLAVMSAAPPDDQATIGAVHRMAHNLANAVGAGIGGALLAGRADTAAGVVSAFDDAWRVAAAACLVGLVAVVAAHPREGSRDSSG